MIIEMNKQVSFVVFIALNQRVLIINDGASQQINLKCTDYQ